MKKLKKSTLLIAAATMVLASCTSDELVKINEAPASDYSAINFAGGSNKVTRADITGADAASLLNNTFRV